MCWVFRKYKNLFPLLLVVYSSLQYFTCSFFRELTSLFDKPLVGYNGNMVTVPENETTVEVNMTWTQATKLKSTTLQELIGLGKDPGYSGKELQHLVMEQ